MYHTTLILANSETKETEFLKQRLPPVKLKNSHLKFRGKRLSPASTPFKEVLKTAAPAP